MAFDLDLTQTAVVRAAQALGVGDDIAAAVWLELADDVQAERDRLCDLIGAALSEDVARS